MSAVTEAPATLSLLDLATKHKADKAVDHRRYYEVYEELLSPRRFHPINLLEIGILNGGSHLAWIDWMPQACVWGIDVKVPIAPKDAANYNWDDLHSIEKPHPRLQYALCSQDDREGLERLFKYNSLDVIIDDGSHVLYHQLTTCLYLWHSLRKGGYYFIEDVQDAEHLKYFKLLPGFLKAYSFGSETGRYDDTLVVLKKE